MENKTKINWWAMLAAFLLGAVLGFVLSPVKNGFSIGSYNNYKNKVKHSEREGDDLCDYDFDDYYDDDLQYRDNEDNALEDETQSFSF